MSSRVTGCAIGGPRLTAAVQEVEREATIVNREGLHARPVMRFVDMASGFQASITVCNLSSKREEQVDGKSAMEMMLLEATQGCVLRIQARGVDAQEAADRLAALVEAGFNMDSHQGSSSAGE